MTPQDAVAPAPGGIGITAVTHTLRAHGLPLQVGSMSTLTWGDHDTVFAALREAFAAAVAHGPAVLQVTVSNACPLPAAPSEAAPHG